MPSGSNSTHSTPPDAQPRLRLKPALPASGHVDGAWWPRTRDLAAELPALLTALTDQLGRIDRVAYHLDEWPDSHRRISFDGEAVRLEGFRSQRADTLSVVGWNRRRLIVQVVPPDTDPEAAARVLETAAGRDDADDSAHSGGTSARGRVPLSA